jgi:hypothetical protein
MAPIDCEQAEDPLPAAREHTPLTYWADDAGLQASLERVLGRLNTATGLGLVVALGGVPVEFADLSSRSIGRSSVEGIQIASDERTGLWSVVDRVLLHEVGHQLGARHLGPGEGVLSRCLGASSRTLTALDLEQICTAASCATFQPESELTAQ